MTEKNLGRVTGLSAYEIALDNGFEGSEKEWLESLKIGADDIITEEQIQEAVNNYLNEHPVEGMTEIEDGSITVEKLSSSVEPKIINCIKDAKFEDLTNTDSFSLRYITSSSVTDGVLTAGRPDSNGQFWVDIKTDSVIPAEHQYYFSVKVSINNPTEINSNGLQVTVGTSTKVLEIKEGYQHIYGLNTLTSEATPFIKVQRLSSTLNTEGVTLDIKNPIIVDLTETFGAGNEPQAETFKSTLESTYDLSAFEKELPLNWYKMHDLDSRVINVSVKNYAANRLTKTRVGDGTVRYVIDSERAYPANLGTFKHYVGVKVKCSKPCNFRLWNSSSFSENILNVMSTSDKVQLREGTIAVLNDAEADTEYYLYGTIDKTVTSIGASRSIGIIAEFDTAEDANGAELTTSNLVCINLTEHFGEGFEPDAETVFRLLGKFENHHFVEDVNLFNEFLMTMNNHRALASEFYDAYVKITDNKNVKIGGDINPNWEGWQHVQNSYGNHNQLCPIPTEFHGKIVTDAQVSVVPLYGHWGQKATTTGGGMWGGHVFHGWNDAQTYRLTAMASGGMTGGTVEGFKPREDEFCLHVFSPTNAYDKPINITAEEAENRITREQEDIFSGGAYYGRLRIGADKADEGFLFRSKSLTCFGRLDMNGNKFILGNQITNVPISSSSGGVVGQIAFDENYFYVCVETNTWKRFSLEAW